MANWKLTKIISFTGTVECVTGLSIRSGANELGIGGADSEVLRNPLTGEPYLPGSSLKGKMRSQLEHVRGLSEPCGCGRQSCSICTVFGAHKNTKNNFAGPTRILVRDGVLTDAFREKVAQLPPERRGYFEVKAENIINRSTGVADSPRFMERVYGGTEFTLDIQLQIFEGDDEEKLVNFVKQGLALVEASYLGNSGSRGYGKVKFQYEITETPVAGIGKKASEV